MPETLGSILNSIDINFHHCGGMITRPNSPFSIKSSLSLYSLQVYDFRLRTSSSGCKVLEALKKDADLGRGSQSRQKKYPSGTLFLKCWFEFKSRARNRAVLFRFESWTSMLSGLIWLIDRSFGQTKMIYRGYVNPIFPRSSGLEERAWFRFRGFGGAWEIVTNGNVPLNAVGLVGLLPGLGARECGVGVWC
jgi:hypothetical protein